MPGPSPSKFSPLLFSMPALDYKVQLAPLDESSGDSVLTCCAIPATLRRPWKDVGAMLELLAGGP